MELFKQKKKRGFTLVEIMIVVAIIALLASIAIPNLQRAHRDAQEANAKKTLKVFTEAVEVYASTTGEYPSNLTSLTSPTPPYLNDREADLCDDVAASFTNSYPTSTHGDETVSGYRYHCSFGASDGDYRIYACSELHPNTEGGACWLVGNTPPVYYPNEIYPVGFLHDTAVWNDLFN